MRGKRQDTKFHSVLPHVFKTGQLVRSTVCEVQIVVTPTGVVTRSGHRGEVLEVLVVLPLLFFFFFNASYMGCSVFENSSWTLFSLWCE